MWYETILEILKYTIPALIVLFATTYTLKKLLTHDQKRRDFEVLKQNQRIITPIRLQAYERVILFLERISPESMLVRLNAPGKTCKQLQTEMLQTIRAEFEHNITQQIYLSPEAWKVVINAKLNITKLINTIADKVKPEAPAIHLSKLILENQVEAGKVPSTVAIEYLKKELSQLMGGV